MHIFFYCVSSPFIIVIFCSDQELLLAAISDLYNGTVAGACVLGGANTAANVLAGLKLVVVGTAAGHASLGSL